MSEEVKRDDAVELEDFNSREGGCVEYKVKWDEYAGVSQGDFSEVCKIRSTFPNEIIRQIEIERPKDLVALTCNEAPFWDREGGRSFDSERMSLLYEKASEYYEKQIRNKRRFGKGKGKLKQREQEEFQALNDVSRKRIDRIGELLSSFVGNSFSVSYVVGRENKYVFGL